MSAGGSGVLARCRIGRNTTSRTGSPKRTFLCCERPLCVRGLRPKSLIWPNVLTVSWGPAEHQDAPDPGTGLAARTWGVVRDAAAASTLNGLLEARDARLV